ncbi:MAG: 3-deoxy-7-phosphoheptulonate synthase [Atopobiaceae bacterium]|nr:3-deoxy-7-phosphoheptulonate synthase [Atopobiaceae bacterium]MBR3315028.1 3-deoxy-7-phosphoheptulonate synthase [Atopobiaceae bacterium]
MSMNFKRRLPIPKEIREEMPLSEELAATKEAFDAEVADALTGKSGKLLVVVGPCSADREDAVLEYVTRLAKLRESVDEKLVLVPRVYTNKPRTNGTGYKGILHNPDPSRPDDLLEGVKAIRHLHLRVVEESGMFTADEMLYPENYQYLVDLISYTAVGARSTENQQHRLVASGVPVPVGMKNPTGGNFSVMLNSIYAAQQPQTFIYRNWEVETSGNPLAHAVLRGRVGSDGKQHANYHYEHLESLAAAYKPDVFANPAVIVDCNHDNSAKRPLEQMRICNEVLDSVARSKVIARYFRGFMIESYLEDGAQRIGDGIYGKSITDPCLGWEKTSHLIMSLADRL